MKMMAALASGVLMLVLAGCGGSDGEGEEEATNGGNLEDAAQAITADLGAEEGVIAVLKAFDRGYTLEQVLAAGASHRLSREGFVTSGGGNEPPGGTPLNRYTATGAARKFVAEEAPSLAPAATAARADPLRNMMLVLELMAESMKDLGPASESVRPETNYGALVALLEMARTGYSADEIFLALADDQLSAEGRVLRRPAGNGGFGIFILNEDGTYQCPEGPGGDYCRGLPPPRAVAQPTAGSSPGPATPTTSAEPARAGCVRGRISFDAAFEAYPFFIGYGPEAGTVELCVPAGGGAVTGTFTLAYEVDQEIFFRGTALAGGGTCKTRTTAMGTIGGTAQQAGGTITGSVTMDISSTVLKLEGCANSNFDEQSPDHESGSLSLSGANGTIQAGEFGLRLTGLR